MDAAKLTLALEMPAVHVAKSFTVIANNYSIYNTESEVMMRLAHHMLAKSSLKEFQPLIDNDKEWNSIRNAYDGVVKLSIENAISVGRTLRNKFPASSSDDLSLFGLDSELPEKQRFKAFIYTDMNRALSIYVLSLVYSGMLGRSNDAEFQRKIFDSHNGSAEPYIRALSVSLLERMERGEMPARNDAFDLDHFAYLKPSTLLITNDKGMRALASKIGVRSETCQEFLRLAHRR